MCLPRTIGKLEPSYVIRKFLDAQRIHNLTAYLQTLHRQSLANADHTTLLLNCYTKLKDSSKLEEFIKVQGGGGGRSLRVALRRRRPPQGPCFMVPGLPMVSKPRELALGESCVFTGVPLIVGAEEDTGS